MLCLSLRAEAAARTVLDLALVAWRSIHDGHNHVAWEKLKVHSVGCIGDRNACSAHPDDRWPTAFWRSRSIDCVLANPNFTWRAIGLRLLNYGIEREEPYDSKNVA